MNRDQACSLALELGRFDHAGKMAMAFACTLAPEEWTLESCKPPVAGMPDCWHLSLDGEDSPTKTYECKPTNRDRWIVLVTDHRDGDVSIWLEPGEVAYMQ